MPHTLAPAITKHNTLVHADNFEAFETALALPAVSGVTVYANLVASYKKQGQYSSCPTVKKGAIPPTIDKGCLIKQIFQQFGETSALA